MQDLPEERVPGLRPPLSKTRQAFCPSSPCFVVEVPLTNERTYPVFYWRHWPIAIWPFWCCFVVLLSYIPYFLFYLLPCVPEESQTFWKVVYLVPLASAAVNFLLTHLLDPGVLPWTWSETRKKSYTFDEIREGIASREDQWNWAASQDRPERSVFSRTRGYFILRGDHDCFWVNNWIGIRNHSYFIRAVYSGSLFAAATTVLSVKIWRMDAVPVSRPLFYILTLIPVGLGLINLTQAFNQSYNISRNQTIVEQLKGLWIGAPNPYRQSCLRNWEEVCGSRWCLPCWLLPIPIPKVEDGFGYLPTLDTDSDILF